MDHSTLGIVGLSQTNNTHPTPPQDAVIPTCVYPRGDNLETPTRYEVIGLLLQLCKLEILLFPTGCEVIQLCNIELSDNYVMIETYQQNRKGSEPVESGLS